MRQIALITGGGRGIGAATARLAAHRGYDVCVNFCSDEASAQAVVRDCVSSGANAAAIKADISDPQQVCELFTRCDAELGTVDLLVNNAGIIGSANRVADLPDDVLRRTFEVNVYGTIACARSAISRMSTSSGGRGGAIINLSSIAAVSGSPGEYVHYAASKGAIESFTIGLAKEVGSEGIRVNAVQAGTVETDIHTRSGNPMRPSLVAQTAPLGRAGQPDDIASAIMWLASIEASYASGSVLKIGGGL